MKKNFSIICGILSIVLTTAIPFNHCAAQADTATISGRVVDPTGAIVKNASVSLVDVDRGQTVQTLTNGSGLYTFPAIKPGHYRLAIKSNGFKTADITAITVNTQDNLEENTRLEVGSQSESMTVNADTINLNTTDGSVSTVVDRQFVADIPLNGRSFQSLILLTPGVITNSSQQQGLSGAAGEFSVNGQRTESNVYTVDGVSANTGGYLTGSATPGTSGSLAAATALGTTQSLVSVDALQEFRVASSSYSAELGVSPGGQFGFTTRSGTNALHGTIFDYLRNNYFDANDWFNDNLAVPIQAERQNDFGGTAGGPVVIPRFYNGMNRSFFFVSYEGLRLDQPQAAITRYVPSAQLRQSAPSALQPVLNAFPIPTGPALSDGLSTFIQAGSEPSKVDATSVRIDQGLGQNLKLFYRFSDTQSNSLSRDLSNVTTNEQNSVSNTVGITALLGPRIVDQFRANYTSSRGNSNSYLDDFGGAIPVSLLRLQGISTTGSDQVGLFFPGHAETLLETYIAQPQQSLNVNDSVTISRGRQSLKLGVDYRRIASRLRPRSPNLATIFFNESEVTGNTPSYSQAQVGTTTYPEVVQTGVYFQDEIRAASRLSISLGLRWAVNPSPTASGGHLPNVVSGNLDNTETLTLAAQGSRFYATTYYNVAPRLGFAYTISNHSGRETIIRGGGGVFFDTGQQIATEAFGNSPGDSAQANYSAATYPLTPAQIDIPIANPPAAPYSSQGYYFPAKQQLPYTLEWNVALDQAISTVQAITFNYVGSNGRRLLSSQLVDGGNNFPDGINVEAANTTSSYNALQLKYQRSLSRGVQALGSYTWSHSIDYGSQDAAYAPIRGNSDYDIRNNFSLGVIYQSPSLTSNPVLSLLASSWSFDTRFSARTGFPVTLYGNYVTLQNGQETYSSLNTVPGAPVYASVHGIAGDRQINPDAFSLPEGNDFGDAPRNFVRGFGMNQLDLAVQRTLPIAERLKLQFRAEAFNSLNHPNFGYIYPYFGSQQFGQATEMLNQSLGNLSPLYQQGGPRSMQFALKVMF